VRVNYKGLWSPPSETEEFTVVPTPPVISGVQTTTTPTISISVDSVAGLLRIYVDGSVAYEDEVGAGLKDISITLPSEGTHTITSDIEVKGFRSRKGNALVVVYKKEVIPAPTLTVTPTVETDSVNVTVSLPAGGNLHISIDGVEVKVDSASEGVYSYTLSLPTPRDIGVHTLRAYVENGGISSPTVEATFTRIPSPPTHNLPPRIILRHFLFRFDAEVDGVAEVSVDGNPVYTTTVTAGKNKVRLDFEERGLHHIRMRLTSGGFSSRWVEHTIFIYDKIELWIGSTTYKLNLRPQVMDTAPFIDPAVNRTMVPLRFILEGLGFDVQWEGTSRMITIRGTLYHEDGSTEERTVYMHMPKTSPEDHGGYVVYPGSPIVRVLYADGHTEDIDMRNVGGEDMGIPFIYQNRTFVPVRFIAELFGATVSWDGAERKVTIER